LVPAEDPNEANETFGPRSGVDARIIDRTNKSAAILKTENAIGEEMTEVDDNAERENGSRKLVELNVLLASFEEEKIQPNDLAQVSLEEPMVLLLAQHGSFRICRRHFFDRGRLRAKTTDQNPGKVHLRPAIYAWG
jgi:hypothetical protein